MIFVPPSTYQRLDTCKIGSVITFIADPKLSIVTITGLQNKISRFRWGYTSNPMPVDIPDLL
jgi:hypothetical protein